MRSAQPDKNLGRWKNHRQTKRMNRRDLWAEVQIISFISRLVVSIGKDQVLQFLIAQKINNRINNIQFGTKGTGLHLIKIFNTKNVVEISCTF